MNNIIKNISDVQSDEDWVYIGRNSKWGNPFIIGKDGDRQNVIKLYRKYLWNKIKSKDIKIADLIKLDGKILVCHCKPLPCHGDVLASAIAWAKREW